MERVKDFFGSLMLTELIKGMALTGKSISSPGASADAAVSGTAPIRNVTWSERAAAVR